MNRASLAAQLEITRQHLDYIFAGKRRPSPELAEKLEKLTGVPRLSWLYSDQYPNPLLKKAPNGTATTPS
jgi:plasmid maintenance system antidote protein VapI